MLIVLIVYVHVRKTNLETILQALCGCEVLWSGKKQRCKINMRRKYEVHKRKTKCQLRAYHSRLSSLDDSGIGTSRSQLPQKTRQRTSEFRRRRKKGRSWIRDPICKTHDSSRRMPCQSLELSLQHFPKTRIIAKKIMIWIRYISSQWSKVSCAMTLQ